MSNPLTTTVLPVVSELLRIMPEAIVIGSGLLALFTLSYPHAIFFGTMIEANVIFRILQTVAATLNISGTSSVASAYSEKCRSGFRTSDWTTIYSFGGDGSKYPFPSYPIFMASTAASYMFATLNALSDELTALGEAYSQRYYFALIFLTMMLFILSGFRLFNSCDGPGTILLSLTIGVILGFVLVQQNTLLFDGALPKQSINLMGIPLLKNKTATGAPIYVCPRPA